ncbi:MAG: hypothetical protein ACYSWQ_16395 [Planctomycetota bacterium]
MAAPATDNATSIGGGINVANNMLMMMREHKLRTRCLFSLIQHGYRAHGIGEVRPWGTAPNMRRGHERDRPTAPRRILLAKPLPFWSNLVSRSTHDAVRSTSNDTQEASNVTF